MEARLSESHSFQNEPTKRYIQRQAREASTSTAVFVERDFFGIFYENTQFRPLPCLSPNSIESDAGEDIRKPQLSLFTFAYQTHI